MQKAVKQKHDFGCGPACVSFVLGLDYDKIIKELGATKAKQKGFYCRDLVSVLAKFGYDYEYNYIKPKLKKRIYKPGVIVFIKRDKNYPAGHYLARVNGGWMDPWINFKKDDNIKNARAGFRKRLPGKSIYALLPV